MVGLKKLLAKILDQLETMLGWNRFSTDEVFTGKYWINGKPIYRKVVNASTSSTIVNNSLTITMPNTETFIKVEGRVSSSASVGLSVPCDNHGILARAGVVSIYFNNATALSYTGWFILEYTKTTD